MATGTWGAADGETGAWGAAGGETGVWGAVAVEPWIEIISPLQGAVDVPLDATIQFATHDDTGTDITGIKVYVNSTLVFSDGVWLAGWGDNSSYAANATNGFDFIVQQRNGWTYGDVINVGVRVENTSGKFATIGWIFTVVEEKFALSIYPMLPRSIRMMEKRSPGVWEQIFTLPGGVDELWKTLIYDKASELSTLYNPRLIDAKWLPWLKSIVGFSRDISLNVSEDELRELIANAVTYWNAKPTELAAINWAVRIATGNQYKVRNYFDFRMQLDKSILAEFLEDTDTFLLDFPSVTPSGSVLKWCAINPAYPCSHIFVIEDLPPAMFPGSLFSTEHQYEYLEIVSWPVDPTFEGFYKIDVCTPGGNWGVLDVAESAGPNSADVGSWRLWGGNSEYVTELRVVDEPSGAGVLNRPLINALINLARPASERIDVIYLAFLEQFTLVADLSQWTVLGAVAITVPDPGGQAVLPQNASMITNKSFASAWGERSVAFKVSGDATAILELQFAYVDNLNYWWVEINYTTKTVLLYKIVAGVVTLMGFSVILALTPGYADVFRINMLYSGATDLFVDVLYNGDHSISTTDSPAAIKVGNIGVRSIGAGTGYVDLIEVMTLPVETDRVGPAY